MKCPHCIVEFHDKIYTLFLGKDIDGEWYLLQRDCPTCHKLIFHFYNRRIENEEENVSPRYRRTPGAQISLSTEEVTEEKTILVRPKSLSRSLCPPQVPKEIAEDYTEACLTLIDSPKASAALSRRCLQNILRDPNAANAQQKDLIKQIEHVLNSRTLPTYIADDIDAIRNIGNFAAHPMKNQETGTILAVEPGEAEWNLNVIEALFDFYYVQPAISQMKRNALNVKLQSAGKPPMK